MCKNTAQSKSSLISLPCYISVTQCSGQFATVKKCTEKISGDEFAAKFMKKKRSRAGRRGVSAEQISREAGVLSKIRHDGIIYLHEVFEAKQEYILVMEL